MAMKVKTPGGGVSCVESGIARVGTETEPQVVVGDVGYTGSHGSE
jgi:hypothetical protein